VDALLTHPGHNGRKPEERARRHGWADPLGATAPRPAPRPAAAGGPVDPAAAEEFLRLHHGECPDAGALGPRLAEVRGQIERYGTYAHTAKELAFGARVARRNAARCIGRLYWRSLRVRDRRHVSAAEPVAAETIAHLREATSGGRIRPTVTVFAASTPERPGPGSGTSR
jgi:nitric-oxide synthase